MDVTDLPQVYVVKSCLNLTFYMPVLFMYELVPGGYGCYRVNISGSSNKI